MAMGHYLLGRPWGVGLGNLEKKANFGQVKLDEFLSSINNLDVSRKVLKSTL